jgi:hypothetical protein
MWSTKRCGGRNESLPILTSARREDLHTRGTAVLLLGLVDG